MKTTIELPDRLLEQAKQYASERGKTFRQVLIEALTDHVLGGQSEAVKPGIEDLFGAFASEREDSRQVQATIDKEFSSVNPGDWK